MIFGSYIFVKNLIRFGLQVAKCIPKPATLPTGQFGEFRVLIIFPIFLFILHICSCRLVNSSEPYSNKEFEKDKTYFFDFAEKLDGIVQSLPDTSEIKSVSCFFEQTENLETLYLSAFDFECLEGIIRRKTASKIHGEWCWINHSVSLFFPEEFDSLEKSQNFKTLGEDLRKLESQRYFALILGAERLMPFLMERTFYPGIFTGWISIIDWKTCKIVCSFYMEAMSSDEVEYWETDERTQDLEKLIFRDFKEQFAKAMSDSLKKKMKIQEVQLNF